MTVNKAILVGNLGRDPELRTTGSGMAVANLNIATNERRKDRDGNWSDHTEWHRVVCFGRTAENSAEYLRKGRQVYIEGKIRTNKWQDKDGRDRYTTEILADVIQFLQGGEGGGSGRPASSGGSSSSSSGSSGAQPYGGSAPTGGDDGIPF